MIKTITALAILSGEYPSTDAELKQCAIKIAELKKRIQLFDHEIEAAREELLRVKRKTEKKK